MSLQTRRDHEPDAQTDLIGIDADGCEHRWHQPTREVIHITPQGVRQRARLQRLGHDSLSAYVQTVDARCGWSDLRFEEALTETIARSFGGGSA